MVTVVIVFILLSLFLCNLPATLTSFIVHVCLIVLRVFTRAVSFLRV